MKGPLGRLMVVKVIVHKETEVYVPVHRITWMQSPHYPSSDLEWYWVEWEVEGKAMEGRVTYDQINRMVETIE